MSLFASLQNGVSGLNAASSGLNTTSTQSCQYKDSRIYEAADNPEGYVLSDFQSIK